MTLGPWSQAIAPRTQAHVLVRLCRLAIERMQKLRSYDARAILCEGAISTLFGTACGPGGRSHPAESQELGMENSDQPQSRQTRMSGEGVKGGWLRIREVVR